MEVILCRMLFMVVIRFIKGGLWVCGFVMGGLIGWRREMGDEL
jgi:hypothetical protein